MQMAAADLVTARSIVTEKGGRTANSRFNSGLIPESSQKPQIERRIRDHAGAASDHRTTALQPSKKA
jgi:hypothetical protein